MLVVDDGGLHLPFNAVPKPQAYEVLDEVGAGLHFPSRAVPKPQAYDVDDEVGAGLHFPSRAVPKPQACETVAEVVGAAELVTLLTGRAKPELAKAMIAKAIDECMSLSNLKQSEYNGRKD